MASYEQLTRGRAEGVIAISRVALAASILAAVSIDPSDPATYVRATDALHAGYLGYSLLLALIVWRRGLPGPWPLVTHAVDIVIFSVFQIITEGAGSPLFVYFVFSIFCGAIRWGWRGAAGTAPIVLGVFLLMGVSMAHALGTPEFELNRFLIRIAYVVMIAGLLIYLGRYEARLRDEMEQLARWPSPVDEDPRNAVAGVLAHAARILSAACAVAAWSPDDEPHTIVAAWSGDGFHWHVYGPAEMGEIVPEEQGELSFLMTSRRADRAIARVGTALQSIPAPKVHERIGPHLAGLGLASAPIRTDRITGRLFVAGIGTPTQDTLTATELVAREVGASLEQIETGTRQRQLAIAEDRVRVARDLHDGVLQSLTAVRLELQGIATSLDRQPAPQSRDRLLALERALAIEQRELRRFIEGLHPLVRLPASGTLADRLHAVRERILLQWKVPIVIRTEDPLPGISAEMTAAIPQMVQEAVVNALKHGHPSRVSVDVRARDGRLQVAVADDGRGFPFQGRYDQRMLAERNLGPTSLCERVASLGGEVTIESGAFGARVEISLPLAPVAA